jgi:peptidoglycan/LPS O-acetylase OafA/YrhL
MIVLTARSQLFDSPPAFLFDPGMGDQSHLRGVDGLRAVAALAVFAAHSIPWYAPGGGNGLDVFFVISGFLITGILVRMHEEDGKVSLSAFYWRRALRIWPALFLLLVVLQVAYLTRGDRSGLIDVGAAATATMNVARAIGITSGGALGHTWTLAIEEQFYLLWPLVLVFTPLLKYRRTLALGLLATFVLAGVGKSLILMNWQPDDFHSDGLVLGSMLAIWRPAWLNRLAVILWPVALLGLALVFLVLTSGRTVQAFWTNSWAAVLTAVIIVAAAEGSRMKVLEFKPLMWLGERSYGFYLWHLPVIVEMYRLDMDLNLRAALAFAVTVVLAALSYRFIEQPIRRYGTSRMPARAAERQASLQKEPAAAAAGVVGGTVSERDQATRSLP